MNRIFGFIALALVMTVIGCNEKEVKRSDPEWWQEPITDQGLEAVKERVSIAAEFILEWAEAHEGVFPSAKSSLELKELMKEDFEGKPGFDECWVSNNGKALMMYNQGMQGKKLSDIRDKSGTLLIMDPWSIQPHGRAAYYLDGNIKMVDLSEAAVGGT